MAEQRKRDDSARQPTPAGDQRRDADRDADRRESGEPGGGAGRRDQVGPTGVYPMSAGLPPDKNAEVRTPGAWGQGDRGAAGYYDSGGSELVMRDGELLGGLTAGPGGEPTIDIHGGDIPPNASTRQAGSSSASPSSEKRPSSPPHRRFSDGEDEA